MFSKLILPPRYFLALFVIPLFLIACETEPTHPLPDGIPKDDIVFMPEGNPLNIQTDGKTLGFINDDGSNYINYTFQIIGGSRSNFGERYRTQLALYPRWSISGTVLAFSIASAPPNVRVIDSQGRMLGKGCDAVDHAFTFDSYGNILGEIYQYSSLYQENKNKITDNASLVARFDIKTCTLVGVFSLPVPQDSGLWNISEAGNGLVTGEFSESNTDTEKIIIFDPLTQSLTSFSGYFPSLSRDCARLAYYSLSGDLIVRDIKSGAEKKIINVFSDNAPHNHDFLFLPGWSPDNEWLVYNTPTGKIYKVNIETGENVFITYGWAPDWRP